MRFNEATVNEINEKKQRERKYYDLGLVVGVSGEDIIRYSGASGWQICKVSEITDMIKSLEDMRTQIECVTGVKC